MEGAGEVTVNDCNSHQTEEESGGKSKDALITQLPGPLSGLSPLTFVSLPCSLFTLPRWLACSSLSSRRTARPSCILLPHTCTALSLSNSLGCASRRSPRLTRRPHGEPNDPFSAGAGGSPRPSSRQEAPTTHPLQSQLARLSRPPLRYRPANANRALRPSCTSGPAHHDDETSSSREAISSS